jgi:hypothetical protein
MILFRPRQGIGLDIEYTQDICHRVVYDDDSDEVLAFNGIIIKLPLCQLYIGDMFGLDDCD